jgi:hypothetical protein
LRERCRLEGKTGKGRPAPERKRVAEDAACCFELARGDAAAGVREQPLQALGVEVFGPELEAVPVKGVKTPIRLLERECGDRQSLPHCPGRAGAVASGVR